MNQLVGGKCLIIVFLVRLSEIFFRYLNVKIKLKKMKILMQRLNTKKLRLKSFIVNRHESNSRFYR